MKRFVVFHQSFICAEQILQETQIGHQNWAYEKIALWYGVANSDPAVFKDPNSFNILRENADKHLAFWDWRHTCLGKASVALMQSSGEFFFTIF